MKDIQSHKVLCEMNLLMLVFEIITCLPTFLFTFYNFAVFKAAVDLFVNLIKFSEKKINHKTRQIPANFFFVLRNNEILVP